MTEQPFDDDIKTGLATDVPQADPPEDADDLDADAAAEEGD